MTKNNFRVFIYTLLILFAGSCKISDKPVVDATETDVAVVDDLVLKDSVPAQQPPVFYQPKDYKESRIQKNDIIHTKLDVSFDWAKQHLLGIATLEVKPYFYPQNSLLLDAKGFDIHEVVLLNNGTNTNLEYEYDNLKLDIALDKEYTRNEKFTIQIKYTAKPNEMEVGGSAAITSDKGLYFINPLGEELNKPRQIWTQGETESSSKWFPTIDAPNQRCTQEMYITVDEKLTTLSNGVLVYSKLNGDGTKTDYWKMELPHAPYLFMMAIGEFAIVKDKWGDIDVDYYVEPAYEKYARSIFGNTPEMMTFFSELLNYPYPWPKYAQVVVRDYVSGAMENTSASIFMEQLQVTDQELIDTHWDYIIAHELFHQWFGNLVTTESWSNLPLNESFANYSEYLWNEYKYGKDEADYHALEEAQQYLKEAESKQVDLIRFYYNDKEDMFDSHSYSKGGRILHMLRKYVGDDAFFKSLEHYLKKNEFSSVEVHNLRLAFEEITGEDLNWFFNQWFLAAGHPILDVSHQYLDGKVILEVSQKQDTSKFPVYSLPLYVDIYVDGRKERFAVKVDKPYQVLEFQVGAKPSLVVFDAEHQLLAEINHEKDLEELAFQYNNSTAFLARNEALQTLSENIYASNNNTIVAKALDDPFWGLRQLAVNAFENYEGDNLQVVEQKLISMALQDKKSVVRADAIGTLSSIDSTRHADIYKKGMEDPSLVVIGASLYAYGKTNEKDKDQVFGKFEKVNNVNVIVPIANYYLESQQFDKADWFIARMEHLKGADLYYMLQYLGQLALAAPPEVQTKTADVFHDYAINNDLYYVRLAAFQGLVLLEDVAGVEQMIQKVMSREKNPQLLQYYQNMTQ